jgi:ABC-2 type transport system ATP-binding protein
MSAYIEVTDAVKRFKETTALDHVNLSLEQGKIHGIIGRNGSGKTVLLKCICGFMELTEGTITIDGNPVKHNKPQKMGIIIEQPGFIGSVSGYKNLSYLAGLSGNVSKERIREVLEIAGLADVGKKPVRKYSMGMRQRLGIAQAIMEDPPLLLLDEPMNGLDNNGVVEIRELLLKLRDEGKTILLASHGKEDIEILCDDVHELDHGKLIDVPDLRNN